MIRTQNVYGVDNMGLVISNICLVSIDALLSAVWCWHSSHSSVISLSSADSQKLEYLNLVSTCGVLLLLVVCVLY